MVCVLGEAYLCVYVCKSGKIAFGTLMNLDFPTRSNAPRWNVGYDALRHSRLFVWTRERPVAGFQRGALEPVVGTSSWNQ